MAGRIKGITVEIGGDTTGLEKALKAVNSTIKSTQSELKDVNKLLKLDPTNTELLSQKQKLLKNAVSATKEKLDALKDAQAQAKQQLENGELGRDKYDALQREIIETEQELKRLQEQAIESNAALAKIEEIGGKLESAGNKISGVGQKLLPVTAGVTALGTAAVKTTADFDSSMSQVQATMGITSDAMSDLNGESVNTMDSLRDLAKQMGSKTAFSASECADAMNYLALAGYDTQEIYNTLPTVLNLAASGGIDLASASDMVTDAMSALGMETSQADTMVDQMAKTASSTNTSVAQLGEGILTIGATAKSIKGGTAELNTALGILANNGIKGAEGGTHLRNVILSLQNPTDKAADQMEALGVSVYDSEGNMRSMNDILGDLNTSMDGMTAEEKSNIISKIFNKTDLSAVNALLANTGDTWDDLQQSIIDSGGAAQQMADTQLDNLSGQLIILKSALEGLAISFGEILMPMVRSAVEKIQAFVDKLNSLDDAQKQTIIRVAAVAAATSVHIGYTVYNPASLTSRVAISVNGVKMTEQTVDRTQQMFTYRADEIGPLTIVITTGSIKKIIEVTVKESQIHIDAETEALALYLTSYGRSNNEETKDVWEHKNIRAALTGFNYTSDGWKADEDGTTVLRVSGDARVTIPYKIFASDFRAGGKTIELEFATRDVMNYDAVILSCLSGGRGIELTPQKVTFRSEQTEIFTQYKENEHVRIAFVIEKRSENRLVYCYINGIMSGVVQYPADDDFAQTNPVDISIGSNECTIDLYCIRVYDNDLTRHQVLNNWIADTQVVDVMLERYKRNSIYDDYGNVVIAQLPSDLPYLVLEAEELPQYKGDKKTITGTYVDPITAGKSFTFEGASANVQGTSSQYYARKNYKITFKKGFVMNNGTKADVYALRSGAVGTDAFTFKADVASSEGANNVELARLYNDTCPYRTPAQKKDDSVRQGIDGFPIVIFWNDGDETTFLGKYNFNNDKGTPEVFGFEEGDESWEVLNNTSDRVLWKSADYSGDDWQNDFESRFPEEYFDSTQLAEFAAWVKSTDTTEATGRALGSAVTYEGTSYTHDTAEYRLAKFKAELGNYVEKDSALFYYLFTELFLMVDSRAKNMFPSFIGGAV